MLGSDKYRKMEQVIGPWMRAGFVNNTKIKIVENKIGGKKCNQHQAILEKDEHTKNKVEYGR